MDPKITYTRDGQTYLTPEHFRYLIEKDLIIDCSEGGLVLGPSLDEGGIQLINPTRNAEILLSGKMEGWTFLYNAFVSIDYKEAIKTICESPKNIYDIPEAEYEIPKTIKVIRATPKLIGDDFVTPYLYFSTNFIGTVSKGYSISDLKLLNDMNREAWQTHFIEANPTPTVRTSAALTNFNPRSSN
mgnify:CR=1 FL=1